MSVKIKEAMDTPTKEKAWKLPTTRYTTWIKHLFGFHHSSCRHANPLTYTALNAMQQYAVEKDAIKKEYFESIGYTVHIIWESEILDDIDKINEFVKNIVKENG